NFPGVNPYFHSSEFIRERLSNVSEIKRLGPEVLQVYFYSAGSSAPSLAETVRKGLEPHFPMARIHVEHDLKACAFATYTGQPAISCILGTGSNCVYFDGKAIREGLSGLGFILGDEGSASYIGKEVVRTFLYRTMPEKAREDFERS